MSDPSLREPLEHVTTCYKAFGEAFCALVEAVGEREADDDVPILFWKNIAEMRTVELNEAKAEIVDLRKQRDDAEEDAAYRTTVADCMGEERDEAKTEIERLQADGKGLAKAARELLLSISMDMVNGAVDCAWTRDEAEAVAQAWDAARHVLARHQKEETDGASQGSPAPMVAGDAMRPGSAGAPEPIDLDGSG